MGYFTDNTVISPARLCLDADHEYKFAIHGSYGDGICSGDGDCGSYKLSLNDELFVAGGGTEEDDFEDSFVAYFGKDFSTSTPTSSPTNAFNCSSMFHIKVETLTDTFADVDNTTWTISKVSDGKVLMSSGQLESSKTYVRETCVTDDEKYTLKVDDGHGDGICSEPRSSCGYVKVFVDENEIVSVGESLANNFNNTANKPFKLAPTTSPTGKPTKSPPTSSPTTSSPTSSPTTSSTTSSPTTSSPTSSPNTSSPTSSTTSSPTSSPTTASSTTASPTSSPTSSPT